METTQRVKEKELILFYGHHEEDGKLTKACFSQFYPAFFDVDGITYCCAEQYMMSSKAVVFRDGDTLKKILSQYEPKRIKALGRTVKDFNVETWVKVSFNLVCRGNFAKFSQNEKLKEFLLGTGDAILAEASPTDKIWGIGHRSTSRDATNPKLWKGKNLLGKVLMEVRAALAANESEKDFAERHPVGFDEEQKKLLKETARMILGRWPELTGMTADAWRRLTPEKQKELKNEIEKSAKARNTAARIRAEKPKRQKRKKVEVPPVGTTRLSLIEGLADPTSRKWALFEKDGPYWEYLEWHLRRKCFIKGNEWIIEDVINNTFNKMSKVMTAKRFERKRVGCFRAFLKLLATREALDILRSNWRREGTYKDKKDREERRIENEKEIWKEITEDPPEANKERDEIESENMTAQNDSEEECGIRLVRLDEVCEFGDEERTDDTRDEAAMSEWMNACSREELKTLHKMQLHIVYLALGFVLSDVKIDVRKRWILQLMYLEGWKPERILKDEEFRNMKRNTFDKLVFDAKNYLRKKALGMWKLVAPKVCTNTEHELAKSWAQLASNPKRRGLAKKLKNRADEVGGKIS